MSKCAVKIIEKRTIDAHQNRDNLKELIKSELNMLKNLVHPHIVHVLELLEDNDNLYFAMELIENGNLMDVLDEISTNNYNFTAADAAGLVLQILSALNYMHKQEIMHRDLKLQNVMVNIEMNNGVPEMVCKLTDFGFSCVLEQNHMSSLKLGTKLYMAPEIFEDEPYDKKVDTWALGVLTYIMLTSAYPFTGKTKK